MFLLGAATREGSNGAPRVAACLPGRRRAKELHRGHQPLVARLPEQISGQTVSHYDVTMTSP